MDRLIQKLLREGLNEVHTPELSPDEQLILDDLVSVNEAIDFGSLIQKFKKHAKAGALTVGIVLSLLSNDALAQEQKQQVMQVAQTTMSTDEVKTIQQKLKDDLGLEFNSDFVKDRFTAISKKSEAPALPKGEELRGIIINSGVPSKYIDNIYVDYITDATGNETAGVKISVRLKEDGNFKRLNNKKNQRIIMQRVIEGIKKKAFSDGNGDNLPVTLEVKTPDGGIIGQSSVKL
jgi:hypothetical protein